MNYEASLAGWRESTRAFTAETPRSPRRSPLLPSGTLAARTHLPQVNPRINSQIVIIVPRKFQRVLADRLRRQRFRRWLEHRKRPGGQLRRLARLSSRLCPLVLAQRARASIPQEFERIDGLVSVLPLDLHTRAGRQVNLDRPRIIRQARRRISYRHSVSIARAAPAKSAVGSGLRLRAVFEITICDLKPWRAGLASLSCSACSFAVRHRIRYHRKTFFPEG
jgi:hypothetical protein